MPPGSVFSSASSLAADALRELHGVGVAFLVDGELDALIAVEARDGGAILVAAFDARDVLQVHGLTVDVGDHRVRHVIERVELVDGADQEALRALFEPPAGQVYVLGADALRDLLDRKPQLRQSLLVDVDLHFVFETAADLDRRRAFDRLDLGLDAVVGEAAQEFEPVFVAARLGGFIDERHAHDRFAGRVEAQQQRPRCFDGQPQQVEALAHLDAGEVHVRAPGEFDDHVRLAGARHRAHRAHVAHHAGRFFDGARDQVFDFGGRRARQLGADGQRRVRQVRQQVHLEPRQRNDAQQGDRHRRHGDGDAPANREVHEAHD